MTTNIGYEILGTVVARGWKELPWSDIAGAILYSHQLLTLAKVNVTFGANPFAQVAPNDVMSHPWVT